MSDFKNIYQEFQPKLARYIVSLVGEDDAPDLVQAVLLKVSLSVESFRGDSSLDTWIFRIATNTAHDHLQAPAMKQRERELHPEGDDSLDTFPDADYSGTDEEYIRSEMNSCIRGIVGQLPENYRSVIFLSQFEEFTNAEIAEILGVSIENIKIRLHRARFALRKMLESECCFYRDERNEIACDRKQC